MTDSKRINELVREYKATNCNFTRKQIICELTNLGFFPERKQFVQNYDYANLPDTLLRFNLNEIYGGFLLVLGLIAVLGEVGKYL